jgi:hypothetical protein
MSMQNPSNKTCPKLDYLVGLGGGGSFSSLCLGLAK